MTGTAVELPPTDASGEDWDGGIEMSPEERTRRLEEQERPRQAEGDRQRREDGLRRQVEIQQRNERILNSDCNCIRIKDNGEYTCLDGLVQNRNSSRRLCDIRRRMQVNVTTPDLFTSTDPSASGLRSTIEQRFGWLRGSGTIRFETAREPRQLHLSGPGQILSMHQPGPGRKRGGDQRHSRNVVQILAWVVLVSYPSAARLYYTETVAGGGIALGPRAVSVDLEGAVYFTRRDSSGISKADVSGAVSSVLENSED